MRAAAVWSYESTIRMVPVLVTVVVVPPLTCTPMEPSTSVDVSSPALATVLLLLTVTIGPAAVSVTPPAEVMMILPGAPASIVPVATGAVRLSAIVMSAAMA